MVTTRKQDALQAVYKEAAAAPDNLSNPTPEDETQLDGEEATEDQNADDDSEPPRKKVKIETPEVEIARKDADSPREPGTTERGHIYFFFRPPVETDAPSSLDDVKNLTMLRVPRPPKFSAEDDTQQSGDNSDEMKLLTQGADAVPAAEPLDIRPSRTPIHAGEAAKRIFGATVTAVGDDLDALENRMGEQTYNTKNAWYPPRPSRYLRNLDFTHWRPCWLQMNDSVCVHPLEVLVYAVRHDHISLANESAQQSMGCAVAQALDTPIGYLQRMAPVL
ncbi:hypothetical protein B0H14DRAFT_3895841 [Mycena olivaceomarginata]|nr:hypothetical protein B0H14DRAFT_3895841 [Mycena olivaceomarginata]